MKLWKLFKLRRELDTSLAAIVRWAHEVETVTPWGGLDEDQAHLVSCIATEAMSLQMSLGTKIGNGEN